MVRLFGEAKDLLLEWSDKVGSGFIHKYKVRLSRLARYKHPGLIVHSISDEKNKFQNVDTDDSKIVGSYLK